MARKRLRSLVVAPGLAAMGLLFVLLVLGGNRVGAARDGVHPVTDALAQNDTFTVSGTVTCEGIGPLLGVEVFVWDREGGDGLPDGTTDGNGYYSVTLPAGNYDLIFNPPCDQDCASLALKGITGPPDQTRNVTLPPGYNVSGTVTDGTTPIGNVSIYAYNRDTADGFGLRPTTFPNGQYCADLVSGTYELGFTPPPCQGLGPKTDVIVVDQDVVHNVILPPGFTVGGCVTDGVAAPVPGVQIYAYDPPPGPGGFGFAPTGETGCYSGTLPTGSFDFQFIPPPGRGLGSITVVDQGSQGSGCPNTTLNVTLPPGVTLSGTATCNGTPLKNVFVYAEPLEGVSPEDDLVGWGLYSVDDGSYALPLVPGVYDLKFIPPSATGLGERIMAGVQIGDDRYLIIDFCPIHLPIITKNYSS